MYKRQVRDEVVLKVQGLSRKGVFEDVSFELRKGEILGFAGLVGAGRTEEMCIRDRMYIVPDMRIIPLTVNMGLGITAAAGVPQAVRLPAGWLQGLLPVSCLKALESL